jgi:hypothetical protein
MTTISTDGLKHPLTGGSGARFGHLAIILAGVSAISASLITFLSVWLQTKNYRKPLLQRYTIRILVMVPVSFQLLAIRP